MKIDRELSANNLYIEHCKLIKKLKGEIKKEKTILAKNNQIIKQLKTNILYSL